MTQEFTDPIGRAQRLADAFDAGLLGLVTAVKSRCGWRQMPACCGRWAKMSMREDRSEWMA
jgi:hypothetical protein